MNFKDLQHFAKLHPCPAAEDRLPQEHFRQFYVGNVGFSVALSLNR